MPLQIYIAYAHPHRIYISTKSIAKLFILIDLIERNELLLLFK